MELDNQSETNNEVVQPVETLASDAEVTETAPTESATEEQEFYVDDSSDDQENSHKTEMTQAQAYAAFQKKKKQSAARKAELDAEKAEKQRLQAELDALKQTVGKLIKPPEIYDDGIDGDATIYAEKMREYLEANKTVAEKKAENNDNANVSTGNEEDEFYLYQHEQALSKVIPSYEEKKQKLVSNLSEHGITNHEGAMNYLSRIARLKNLDVAKVVVAMAEVPSILDDVIKAGSNDILVADLLAGAEKKVKTRGKKKIDSKPEPEINNQGVIDNSAATVAKLKEAWVKNPTIANHKRYINAKNKT